MVLMTFFKFDPSSIKLPRSHWIRQDEVPWFGSEVPLAKFGDDAVFVVKFGFF